jgi:hypothetical protein
LPAIEVNVDDHTKLIDTWAETTGNDEVNVFSVYLEYDLCPIALITHMSRYYMELYTMLNGLGSADLHSLKATPAAYVDAVNIINAERPKIVDAFKDMK